MKKVIEAVIFGCTSCKSDNLKSMGAVMTHDKKVYLMFNCECGEAVPIELDSVVAELYKLNFAKGSRTVQ